MRGLALILAALVALPALASPCAGVDRALPAARKAAFAPAVAAHLNRQLGPQVNQTIVIAPDDILQLFRLGRWHILYVNNHVSDEPFLFYRDAPQRSPAYALAWAGAATRDEGPAIEKWVRAEAPGIPRRLAACFAWHVTQDRDR